MMTTKMMMMKMMMMMMILLARLLVFPSLPLASTGREPQEQWTAPDRNSVEQ
jgi:hypothetical protein